MTNRVWKPWSGEPTLESVVRAYCDQQRARYELLEELANLRAAEGRTAAVVATARQVLEWPQKKYLVQLNHALEALDSPKAN
jgi:hypothetical protein